jgi:hypothetical protein
MDDRLKLVYENSQHWLRHYQATVVTLNTFALTAFIAFFGFVVQQSTETAGSRLSGIESLILFFPILLSVTAIAVTYWIDKESLRGFRTLIRVERGLGLYDPHPLLDRRATLDEALMQSDKIASPVIRAFYYMHGVAIIADVAVSFYLILRAG